MSAEKSKEAEVKASAQAEEKPIQSSEQAPTTEMETAPGKTDESKEQVEAPKAAASLAKEDEAGKQVEATLTAAEPGKRKISHRVKGETPGETIQNYLAYLNAVDTEATAAEGEGTLEQDSGAEAEAEPDDEAGELSGTHWLDDVIKEHVPVFVIKASQDLDQGELLGDEDLHREMANFKSTLNDKSKTIEERANQSTSLLARFYSHCNFAAHRTDAIFTDYAIMTGKLLVAMKDFVKAARKTDSNFPQWSAWAAANIDFLSERRRQEYMSLAERPDAHAFSYLGIERLLHLTRATEGMSGDNPIGDFLNRYNIRFDPEDEVLQISDFKYSVDAALAVHKAEEMKVTLDLAKVKTLIQVGGEVDRKMLADFALVSEMGADPNEYVDMLIRNRGKRVDFFEGEDLVQKIVTLFNRLEKGLDKLMADPNTLKKLAISEIEPLESRISSLRETLGSLPPSATEDIPPRTVNILSRLEKGLDKLLADPNTLKKLAISQLEPLESRIASLKATLSSPSPVATEDSPPAPGGSSPPAEKEDNPPPTETE